MKVDAEGFTGVENTEQVAAGEATEATYRLAPKSEGLEVTVQGERPPREVTRRTLQRREINRIPGTGGDALRSIQSLPGVARPPGFAGLLIVRGSAPQDTHTFIDGSNVPLIYHFGGLSSVVPTELLDKIDFYPGNFSARYGRVMGGIVDAGLRSPDTRCTGDYGKPTNKDGCYHGMAEVDLIDGRLLLQGPIGPLKHWSFAAAARRSWIDTWIKPVLEQAGAGVTTAPVYYDYQLIADNKPTHDSDLSLRFYGSDDRLEILIKDPAAEDPGFGGNLTFGTAFWRGQALYKGQLSPDVELDSMLSVGRDTINFSIGSLKFDLTSYPVSMRNEFGWRMTKGVKMNFGMDFVMAPYKVSVRAPPPPRPGEPDPGPFSTRPPLETTTSGTAFRPAWYVEGELQPTRRLRIVPGARLDYSRDSGHADFSPRVNARYDIVSPNDSDKEASEGVHKRLRTTIKGGVGVFAQPPQFQETNPVFGTPGLYSNRAIHYYVGVEQEFTKHVQMSLEGFYKDMSQLVERVPSGGGLRLQQPGHGLRCRARDAAQVQARQALLRLAGVHALAQRAQERPRPARVPVPVRPDPQPHGARQLPPRARLGVRRALPDHLRLARHARRPAAHPAGHLRGRCRRLRADPGQAVQRSGCRCSTSSTCASTSAGSSRTGGSPPIWTSRTSITMRRSRRSPTTTTSASRTTRPGFRSFPASV